MKKLFMLLALLALLFNVGGAFAADGDELSTTSFRVDSNGQVYYKRLYEVATTSDTLTAAESGKTIIYNPATSQSTFTLPTAAAGLEFTFLQAYGHGDSLKKMVLEPADTDTFVGCVTLATTTTFAAGDSLISTTATGDTVTIVGASTKWYCTNRIGTWVDNN